MPVYAYDEIDAAMVRDRASAFREQVARRLSGELSEEQFKPLRLMNGLYLQLHSYMLRIAIPYGVLASDQLRTLAGVAREFDRGYGHFTTRTNLQLHWVRLKDTPEILERLAEADLHAIQTSGNCIRNVTTDPFAGAADDELEDPRAWCELIRQWSTFHPEFTYLPRKFKIAVSGAREDRAATRAHDVGLRLRPGPGGRVLFEVSVGGGLGRTPHLGAVIRRDLPGERLLSYLAAILRTYNRFGRRDNLFKARIKILVAALGPAAFAEAVEAEHQEILKEGIDPAPEEIERIRAAFAGPRLAPLPESSAELDARRAADPAFARWLRRNTRGHRVAGRRIVTVCLKATGRTPGDCSAEEMESLADLADRVSAGEIRVTHAQNLVLPHVPVADLGRVYDELSALGLAGVAPGLAADVIACPGLDYCALANARSIPIAEEISRRLSDPGRLEEIGPVGIKISGCINACGHHHIGDIGVLGVDRGGEEAYQIALGGAAGDDASLARPLGPALPAAAVAPAVEALLSTYLSRRGAGERFIDTYRRLGPDPFKEALHAEPDPAG